MRPHNIRLLSERITAIVDNSVLWTDDLTVPLLDLTVTVRAALWFHSSFMTLWRSSSVIELHAAIWSSVLPQAVHAPFSTVQTLMHGLDTESVMSYHTFRWVKSWRTRRTLERCSENKTVSISLCSLVEQPP